MSLTRKQRRELKKLRAQTQDLLDHQREVLGHAGVVLHEAGRQAKNLSDDYVAPKVDDAIDAVRPTIDRGVHAARKAADRVRIVAAPIVATALANTVKTLERIETGDAAQQLRSFGEQRGLIEPAKKKRSGFGRVVAIGAGVAAAAAVGYALWQAFRTEDDDMWVSTD